MSKQEPQQTRRELLQAALVLASGGIAVAAPRPPAGRRRKVPPIIPGARESVHRGLDYLARTQAADGSWQHYPGITALGVMAVAAAAGTKHPAAHRGARFLAGMAKP